MSTETKHRRDTAANCASATPAEGEIWFDTTHQRWRGGDGSKPGGYPVANVRDVQNQAGVFLTVEGTGSPVDYNTLTGSTGAANTGMNITALQAGMKFGFFAPGENDGAVTLDIDGVGAVAVQVEGVALSGGELKPLRYTEVVVDGDGDLQITGGGGGAAGNLLHVRDEKAAGTQGGGANADTVHTRDLNTVVTNTISGASLSNDRVTLPAGTYDVFGRAPALAVGAHKAFLYSVTGAAYLLNGTSSHAIQSNDVFSFSFVEGRITLAAETELELRHYGTDAKATNGLGVRTNMGEPEVYSNLIIRKVG